MLTKLKPLKTLKNHAGFIRYFKNTSWMMAEQFLRIIARLFKATCGGKSKQLSQVNNILLNGLKCDYMTP